ncbi:MAG: rod shape-determining protein MreC [Bacteroidales bacterium]|nr:rod shape-determining protein MreC [Bacteroidales bacterium]
MNALYQFLAKYYHWLLFVALEGISITLLFQFNYYQNSIWLTTANSAVGRAIDWQQQALRYIHLGDVNKALMQRNILLQQNNRILAEEIAQLTHDSTLSERRQKAQLEGIRLIPARVTTNSVMHRDNLMTINVGSLDGVEPEMGVISGTGVVGIVYMTSSHYSIVLPLLNSRSNISCRLRGTDYPGSLKWDGSNPLYATLDNIPRHARFKIGDIVETSGYSVVFPPGLFMGKIDKVENSDDGLSYKLRVHLSIDFARLQDVCVVAQDFQAEVRELEQRADSLLER